jgi:hypothetical protein
MDVKKCDYIRVTYDKTLKFERIHEILMSIFSHYDNETLQEEISLLKTNADGNQRRIDFLENLLDTINMRERYRYNAENLIREYNIIDVGNNKINIFNLGKKTAENTQINEKKKIIIEKYLEMASEFITIEKDTKSQTIAHCPSCYEPLENFQEVSGVNICPCGHQISTFSVISDNSTSFKSNYEDRNNFMRGMKRKQGKLTTKLPSDLVDKLDEYFERIRGPIRQIISNRDTNEYGEKDDTSMEMMRIALHEIGYSSLYNDIDFIMHMYWGWTLLDFSHLETEMMDFYDETQEVYENIQGKERSASLNMNFRMYEQLRGLNFSIRPERFIFQESEKSLQLHQTYWKIMCEKTDRKYVPFFSK